MYFNKFPISSFGLHYSFELLTVEATQAGISPQTKISTVQATHSSQNDGFYLEKGRHP
ncbi:Hypothetical protein FKW44_024971, partial [Caligus rogercresseyi]